MKRGLVWLLAGCLALESGLAATVPGPAGCFTPNDDICRGTDDAASIQKAVDAAAAAGTGLVTIPPYNVRTGKPGWTLTRSILLPSSVTVVIDNATLTLADGVYANFFRSANTWTDAGRTPEGVLHDIRIVGRGKALLHGGKPNDLTESTSCRDGRPQVRANSPIFFVNVTDFEISGLVIEDHRYWGLCLEYCRHGRIRDVRFIARFDRRNQDGIDLRNGCRDIAIENISGQTGDDMIALSAIDTGRGNRYCTRVRGLSPDIADIVIRNVSGAAQGHPLVALRNHNGAAIHDVAIENVRDTEFAVPCRNSEGKRYAMIRIGSSIYWRDRKSRLGETSRITVRNLDCRYSELAVVVNGSLADSSFSGIHCSGRCAAAVSTGGPWWENHGADIRNLDIADCHVRSDRPDAAIFDCDYLSPGEALQNVVLSRSSLTTNGVCARVAERTLDRCGGRPTLLEEHDGVRIHEDELTLAAGASSGFAVSEPFRVGSNPLFKTDFYHAKGGALVRFSVSTAPDEKGKPGIWSPFRKMDWDTRIDLPEGGWLRYRIDLKAEDGEVPQLMFMRFDNLAHTRWEMMLHAKGESDK